jgi:hypothetical protein
VRSPASLRRETYRVVAGSSTVTSPRTNLSVLQSCRVAEKKPARGAVRLITSKYRNSPAGCRTTVAVSVDARRFAAQQEIGRRDCSPRVRSARSGSFQTRTSGACRAVRREHHPSRGGSGRVRAKPDFPACGTGRRHGRATPSCRGFLTETVTLTGHEFIRIRERPT